MTNPKRAGRVFPQEANELQQIAKTVKSFGLPSCTTDRAVARIREIADRIDGRKVTTQKEGGSNPASR